MNIAHRAPTKRSGKISRRRPVDDDAQTVLDCLAEYGLAFLYRPDITQGRLRWILGGPELLGYAAGEHEQSATAYRSLIHPRDAMLVVQARDEEAAHAKVPRPITCEYRVRHKSGKYIRVRSILTICHPADTGGGPASMEMIRIIDERLSYERAALQLSEDALSTVLNEIGYPVILMDNTGLIVQANDAAEQTCGTIGVGERFCPFLYHPDGSLLFNGFLDKVINLGERATREIHRFRRWWHVHLVPIRDGTHAVARILLLAQDITSLKAAQDERLQQERTLTHALIREVHHRIKNHLQGLVGLIRLHETAEPQSSKLVKSAVTQIQSIAAIHGLLARSGKAAVELGPLVSQIVATHRAAVSIPIRFPRAAPKGGSAELTENEAIAVAVAVSELITNAAKHTERGPTSEIVVKFSEGSHSPALTITNMPARLPENFRLQDRLSQQSGLALVLTLLSGSRFILTLTQEGRAVTARLAVTA